MEIIVLTPQNYCLSITDKMHFLSKMMDDITFFINFGNPYHKL
jgi:hypothetical protein